MSDHAHEWEPDSGRFVCTSCGARGYRPIQGKHRGKILAHPCHQKGCDKPATRRGYTMHARNVLSPMFWYCADHGKASAS